jgi:ABC-type branched-subunit amino acid transport system substrate-binding protein
MLAYDAMLTFLKGIQIASTTHKESITGRDLQQALLKVNGAQTVQGVTGQISLGADGDPVNKETIILQAEGSDHQLKYYEGCFLVGDQDCGGHFA